MQSILVAILIFSPVFLSQAIGTNFLEEDGQLIVSEIGPAYDKQEVSGDKEPEPRLSLEASEGVDSNPEEEKEEGSGSLVDSFKHDTRSAYPDNEVIVRTFNLSYFGEEHWDALYTLVMKESGFNNHAQNPRSTAYGMFQFLNSTWRNYNYIKTSDPITQTEAGMEYIKARYGNPTNALNHHYANNWY